MKYTIQDLKKLRHKLSKVEKELEKVLTALLAPTLQEEGCINYDLHKCPDNPAAFMFYENWRSEETHARHCETSHIKAWQARMDELLAKPYDVSFWEMIRAGDK